MHTFTEQVSINQLPATEEAPYDLLLTADPSREQIAGYITDAAVFTASLNGVVIGVYVLVPVAAGCMEIKNIAVAAAYQGKGLGKLLLRHACAVAAEEHATSIRIATGNSSIGQLYLYQKEGFEIITVVKHFFTTHYPGPIIENGIPCKHLLVLEKKL